MKVIGVTGGVGSGKSRILDILEQEYGAEVIQADLLAKQLMNRGEDGYEKLKSIFGTGILTHNGSIDRPRLAGMMFEDRSVLEQVNNSIHPLVWERIRQQISDTNGDLVVVELALPNENHRDIYSELWYVYTLEDHRMDRLLKDRGYSRKKSKSIMDNQLTEAQFRSIADVVIDNNGSMEETRRQIASRLNNKGR